jgi:hypothetical protein
MLSQVLGTPGKTALIGRFSTKFLLNIPRQANCRVIMYVILNPESASRSNPHTTTSLMT